MVSTSLVTSTVFKVAAASLSFVLGFSFAPAAGAKHGERQIVAPACPTGPPEEDEVVPPKSVTDSICLTRAALTSAKKEVKGRHYRKALAALETLRSRVSKTHAVGMEQIGLPPSDPEEDVPPGPVSVVAVLDLEHRVGVNLLDLFRALRKRNVVLSLRSTLRVTHAKRDEMLDAVIALDPEGEGADYSDGMADTLTIYKAEVKTIKAALNQYPLSKAGRRGLKNALVRVRATQTKVEAAFGGGE